MATQEIYLRNESETEARGPFNIEQVSSLADAGQVNAETLIYDPATEQWLALSAHADLMAAARDDAQLILETDPELSGKRGAALRVLLYLFERDAVVSTLRSG